MENELNVSIVVLSHGPFAESLIKTASMLYGAEGLENVYSVCLEPEEDVETYKERVKETLDKAGDQCLVLVDLYGGTPFNTVVKLSRERRIHALAGVNVALMLEALTRKNTSTASDILAVLEESAGDSVVNITKIIDERMGR